MAMKSGVSGKMIRKIVLALVMLALGAAVALLCTRPNRGSTRISKHKKHFSRNILSVWVLICPAAATSLTRRT